MPDYTNIDYAKITTRDRNPLKRLLQRNRLADALRPLRDLPPDFSGTVLDFGAGNGELCKQIHARWSGAQLVCYEPVENLRRQAEANLAGMASAKITGTLDGFSGNDFDLIFCLEVFEHLPEPQTHEALALLRRLLKSDGKLIIGVPNEIYLAALLKGLFRMARRYGDEDAQIGNVLRAALGFPPKRRKVVDFGGLPYHLRHIGFDYRVFCNALVQYVKITQRYGSPNPALPVWANFEVYFVASKGLIEFPY